MTIIWSPFGHSKYLVMQFGLTKIPTVYQTLINEVLRNFLNVFVFVYLDDILTFSKTLEEHLVQIKSVLKHLLETGYTSKRRKVSFIHLQSLFLVTSWQEGRWRPTQQKSKLLGNVSLPHLKKNVLRFVNFYCCFIWNYSWRFMPPIQERFNFLGRGGNYPLCSAWWTSFCSRRWSSPFHESNIYIAMTSRLGLRKCCSRFSIDHATMQIDWELRLPGMLRGKSYGKYLPQAGPTQHWSLWNQGHHQPYSNKVKAPCIHAHKSHIPRVPSQAGKLQPSVHSFAVFDALPSIPPLVFILVFRTCENLITVSCAWICSWVLVHVLISRRLWHTAHSMFAKAVASLLGGSLFHFDWSFLRVFCMSWFHIIKPNLH